jgi:hypothetical protein
MAALPSAEVDVLLILAVDASSSMNTADRKMQRDGYARALTSRAVVDAIMRTNDPTSHHKIAVTYFEWGSHDAQRIVAPWTIIDSPESAAAFVATFDHVEPSDLQRTSISAALDFAGTLLAQSGLKASRQIVDVSGDGPNNDGRVVSESRDDLVARGITINGLPIVTKSPDDWLSMPDLDQYYEHCVIGGEGAFVIPVRGMANFSRAIEAKLVQEIAGLAGARVQPASAQRDWKNCRLFE